MTLFIAGSIISSGLVFIMAFVTWPRRTVPGAAWLILMFFALGVWSLGAAFEANARAIADKVFWAVVQYPGILCAPVSFLLFTLDYTQHSHWIPYRWRWLLWVFPALTFLVIITNPYHHWFWTGFEMTSDGGMRYGFALWYWALVLYGYTCIFISIVALLRVIIRFPRQYKTREFALLTAVLVPLLGNVFYIFGFGPKNGADITPFFFTYTAIVMALNLRFNQFLDLEPVARDTLVEVMSDGVLVLDLSNRIVDINPTLQKWLKLDEKVIGKPAWEVFNAWNEILEHYEHLNQAEGELFWGPNNENALSLHITPLCAGNGELTGRLLVLRDITAQKRVEKQLLEANAQLTDQLHRIQELQVQLREQAIRDPLTGVFNRRYLLETLELEIGQSFRERTPFSVIMIDLDNFKVMNDEYGHDAGDHVLEMLASLLSSQTRLGDIVCRYGGEEFVIVLARTPIEVAQQRAESLRRAFETLDMYFMGVALKITLSAGISAYPIHGSRGSELIRAADQALYAAKRAGKNCVCLYAVAD